MAGDIREPKGLPYLVHVTEQAQTIGQDVQTLDLLRGESRGYKVLYGP